MKRSSNLPLILSIIFAGLAVSGSLVFLGMQIAKVKAPDILSEPALMDEEAIAKGIETYIAKQNQAQQDAQKAQAQARDKKAAMVPPIKEIDYVRGERDAVISLIEYSDFECPYCKKFHPTAQEFLDNNSGTVNWIYRHFPLGFHDPLATAQAEGSECAGELGGSDAFWKYTDEIYVRTKSNGRGMAESELTTIAKDIGLDEDAFVTCIESDKYLSKIQKDIAEGSAAGVTGTPGNILRNNKTGEVRFISGARPLSALEEAMEDLLQ